MAAIYDEYGDYQGDDGVYNDDERDQEANGGINSSNYNDGVYTDPKTGETINFNDLFNPFGGNTTLGKGLSSLSNLLTGKSSLGAAGQLFGLAGAGSLLNKAMGSGGGGSGYAGYSGGIPTLTANRQMLPIPTTMQNASGQTVARRPGSGGVTYFSPMQYLKPGEAPTPFTPPNQNQPAYNNPSNGYETDFRATPDQLLRAVNTAPTLRDMDSPEMQQRMGGSIAPRDISEIAQTYATGGITSLGGYSDGGQLLRGPGDGVSDSIPASIGNRQPARLADGEFVVPARIVSELGNGSTEAGARKLYEMMDRIKASRAKAKNIAADTKAYKHLPA
jgi:hypothetical protein